MTPALAQALVILGAQYGPEIVTAIIALLQKNNPTYADITNIFAGLQPYSAFGIPANPPAIVVAPAAPDAPKTA